MHKLCVVGAVCYGRYVHSTYEYMLVRMEIAFKPRQKARGVDVMYTLFTCCKLINIFKQL